MEIWASLTWAAPYIFTVLAFILLIEQISYVRKKSILPGPSFVIPFLGNVVTLIRNPAKFWDDQADYAKSSPLGVSANYIIGKFIIFLRSSEMSHKIFANIRPDGFQLVGHPFGKKLFGEHNMIFMFGQEHKDLRRRIAPNFTPKALATYIDIQQVVLLKHIKSWVEKSGSGKTPVSMRFLARDMNLETSQNVFAGPYLMDKETRNKFRVEYNYFNIGVMALPIDLPGFAFRNARLAVDRLVDIIAGCAVESRERMVKDEEPSCLLDFWLQDAVREERESGTGQTPTHCTPNEVARHVFDFLFAAQDASTSSLLWAVTLLDSHPDVLKRVRAEVESVWDPLSDQLITADQLASMKYTQAVAREVVRYRAPATLVPHVAKEDFQLTDDYIIPKGTVVFPSVYESSFQGFSEPEKFDPDRFFDEDRREDQIFKRNYLVFGAGSHQCVGQRYALNLLVLFTAMFATLIDFKRHRTDGCDDINFCPTICPKDDCLVYLSRRFDRLPSITLSLP